MNDKPKARRIDVVDSGLTLGQIRATIEPGINYYHLLGKVG